MSKEKQIKEKQIEEIAKVLLKLTYDLRTNMTSITRYVKHEKSKSPTLTEGQFIDRHIEYRKLANMAVDNILKCINDNEELRQIENMCFKEVYRKQSETKQYVNCSVCRKKLYLGEKVLTKQHYCGVYCSPNCFAQSFDIGCCSTPLSKEFAFRKDVLVKEEMKGGAE